MSTAIAAAMSEDELQSNVRDLCRVFGLSVYHTHDSRRSDPGWPDLAIVGSRLLIRELKTERGKLTRPQQRWLEALRDAGVDVDVWRPADWPARIRTELDAIRRR